MTTLSLNEKNEFQADLDRLKDVRCFVRDFCRRAGIDEDTMYEVQLAASELASNIIQHALKCDPKQSFSVQLEICDHSLFMRLLHRGTPFDYTACKVPEPKFDGSQERGFGLFLVDKIMDECRFGKTDAGEGVVEVRRRLKQSA